MNNTRLYFQICFKQLSTETQSRRVDGEVIRCASGSLCFLDITILFVRRLEKVYVCVDSIFLSLGFRGVAFVQHVRYC